MELENLSTVQTYLTTPFGDLRAGLVHASGTWKSISETHALLLFHQCAKRVPAYKKFLRKHRIRTELIKTFGDLVGVPPTDKKNYIDAYPLPELIWDGELSKNIWINASSGTTGAPYFWPGNYEDIVKSAVVKELIYRHCFQIDKIPTLFLICFGMGTWIAGAYTHATTQLVAQKGFPLTIMTPGFNKEETIRILSLVAPYYEQTIIAGIPTFVKDLLEEWHTMKESKKIKRLRFLFAAEGFSEEWRKYILNLARCKNELTDAVSILGSADSAIMGFETPRSIAIRRLSVSDPETRSKLFHSERVPAFSQYIPTHRFFEVLNGELLISARRSLPLVRYNIHDQGGLLTSEEVTAVLTECGHDIEHELKKKGIKSWPYAFPYVYVFGRGKFTATIYAANIYPENIREVLADPLIRKYVTGKFTLETIYLENQDHYLLMNVELVDGQKIEHHLATRIAQTFFTKVPLVNREYRRIVEEYGKKVVPRVKLFQYQDPTLFPKDRIKKTG